MHFRASRNDVVLYNYEGDGKIDIIIIICDI